AQFGAFAKDDVSRPFDRRRSGFVLGEGGALILLESADGATARGARIYGELLGVGGGASRTRLNGWPGEPAGTAIAIQAALDDAETTADQVDVVFAAGNGSSRLDAVEAGAIRTVFGDRRVPVVSLKGAIGESGTAGAAAIIVGLLTMADGIVPPTVGFAEPGPDGDGNATAAARAASGSTFLVNAIASGGTNYSILMRAAPSNGGFE